MSLFSRIYSIGPVRSLLWRGWYPFVTRRLQGEGVVFLKYGFETEPAMGLALAPEDEPNRACTQLYQHVGSQAPLAGKHVLEVSCGHGGGAAHLARTQRPSTYTGVDLNPHGIRFCQERHAEDGLTFIRGDAENLPFAAETVDVVINIEASHCYSSFPDFLVEVARVLRPGGHFLYADFRFRDELSAWELALAASPLEQVRYQGITPEVLRGLDYNAARSLELVARRLPKWLQSLGRDFAGIPGSRTYGAFQSGEMIYRSYLFVKRRPEGSAARGESGVPFT